MNYRVMGCAILVLISIQNRVQAQSDTSHYLYDGDGFVYAKPKNFSFITSLPPQTFSKGAKQTFQRKSVIALSVITGSALLLIPLDQSINDGIFRLSQRINLDPERRYKTLIGFDVGNMEVNVYEVPQNLNTFFYSIGEGSTSILICTGLYLHGKIKQDYKSLHVSSQLLQALLAVGITTQFVKRISGRESPFVATTSGGRWQPFTNPVVYQSKVPSYDAFPSGHLATMMATTTILTLNYPDKKWIQPVGFSLIGLVGLAMVNNGVHWASDYPLALGVGYLFGKVTFSMNRWVRGELKK